MRTHSPAVGSRGDIETMLASYLRHIQAANYSPKTVSTYRDSDLTPRKRVPLKDRILDL